MIRRFTGKRKELFTNSEGGSLVEMVMVMMLLILFGATIYTLIYTGSNTQRGIIDEKNASMEARVAISYINTRLRQNDVAGGVSIEEQSVSGGNGILIRERDKGYDIDTWIFWSDGVLKECLVNPGEEPTDKPGMFTPIASISGFQAADNGDGSFSVTVESDYKGATREIESVFYLRSLQGSELFEE